MMVLLFLAVRRAACRRPDRIPMDAIAEESLLVLASALNGSALGEDRGWSLGGFGKLVEWNLARSLRPEHGADTVSIDTVRTRSVFVSSYVFSFPIYLMFGIYCLNPSPSLSVCSIHVFLAIKMASDHDFSMSGSRPDFFC